MTSRLCPECGSDWDGGSIIETFIKQRDEGSKYWGEMTDEQIEEQVKTLYRPPYRWGREIGIETPDYDGISYWKCPDCDTVFDRWTMKKVGG